MGFEEGEELTQKRVMVCARERPPMGVWGSDFEDIGRGKRREFFEELAIEISCAVVETIVGNGDLTGDQFPAQACKLRRMGFGFAVDPDGMSTRGLHSDDGDAVECVEIMALKVVVLEVKKLVMLEKVGRDPAHAFVIGGFASHLVMKRLEHAELAKAPDARVESSACVGGRWHVVGRHESGLFPEVDQRLLFWAKLSFVDVT